MILLAGSIGREPMLDMYIFETIQLVEQLEQLILDGEKLNGLESSINEIFRIMHTIKGSSSMMLFTGIASVAHAVEDVFFCLREDRPGQVNYPALTDIVLGSIDFIKAEISKIENGKNPDGDACNLVGTVRSFLSDMKESNSIKNEARNSSQAVPSGSKFYVSSFKSGAVPKNKFKAVLYFEDGCEMENIRAFSVIHNLKDIVQDIQHLPEDIIDNEESVEVIRRNGFHILFTTDMELEKIKHRLEETLFIKELKIEQAADNDFFYKPDRKREILLDGPMGEAPDKRSNIEAEADNSVHKAQQSYISVSVAKMDKLMDLVGEMVTAEAMVIQNPDLKGIKLDNFQKAARQLSKITGEIQDMVMSIRMVPLAATFHKMHRVVRDMCKNLGKEVKLEIAGEETEVDKNIIEHISDPLMHLIRNSIDHGIEPPEDRQARRKPSAGMIALEARSAGSDVLIIVKDDGKGLNKSRILQRARENGLLYKPENEMSDREIFNLILLPGFSTKDSISEYSGRGVGMDVVTKNIEKVGGSVLVDSTEGNGTVITLKIPLTLAIIDGMNIRVGSSCYTIPTISIKESFRPKEKDIITDPDGNEMIMVRGQCYPVLPLHEHFGVMTETTEFTKGILIMVDTEDKTMCIFADELLGQQQVVVKALPAYIKNSKKINGLAGCTLLGDGSISLILDVSGLASFKKKTLNK